MRGLLGRLRVSGHDSEIPETVGATSDAPMQIPNQSQLTLKFPCLGIVSMAILVSKKL